MMMMTIHLLTSLYIDYVYYYLSCIITFIDRTYIYNYLIMIYVNIGNVKAKELIATGKVKPKEASSRSIFRLV